MIKVSVLAKFHGQDSESLRFLLSSGVNQFALQSNRVTNQFARAPVPTRARVCVALSRGGSSGERGDGRGGRSWMVGCRGRGPGSRRRRGRDRRRGVRGDWGIWGPIHFDAFSTLPNFNKVTKKIAKFW